MRRGGKCKTLEGQSMFSKFSLYLGYLFRISIKDIYLEYLFRIIIGYFYEICFEMRRGGECKTLGEQEACMVSKSSLLQVIMELGALGKHHLSKFISTAQIENPSYLSFEKLSENNIALHDINNII